MKLLLNILLILIAAYIFSIATWFVVTTICLFAVLSFVEYAVKDSIKQINNHVGSDLIDSLRKKRA